MEDIRITDAPTPSARLAAVLRRLLIDECSLTGQPYPFRPDYKDLECRIERYVKLEFACAELDFLTRHGINQGREQVRIAIGELEREIKGRM